MCPTVGAGVRRAHRCVHCGVGVRCAHRCAPLWWQVLGVPTVGAGVRRPHLCALLWGRCEVRPPVCPTVGAGVRCAHQFAGQVLFVPINVPQSWGKCYARPSVYPTVGGMFVVCPQVCPTVGAGVGRAHRCARPSAVYRVDSFRQWVNFR